MRQARSGAFYEKQPAQHFLIEQKSTSFLLKLVDFMELLGGFEPPTSSLPRTRSTNWAIAATDYYAIIVKFNTLVKLNNGIFEIFSKKNPEIFIFLKISGYIHITSRIQRL